MENFGNRQNTFAALLTNFPSRFYSCFYVCISDVINHAQNWKLMWICKRLQILMKFLDKISLSYRWYFLDTSKQSSFENDTAITRSKGYDKQMAWNRVWYGQNPNFFIWWKINDSYFGAYNSTHRCLTSSNQYGRLHCNISQNAVSTYFYFSKLESNMNVVTIAVGYQSQVDITVKGECERIA